MRTHGPAERTPAPPAVAAATDTTPVVVELLADALAPQSQPESGLGRLKSALAVAGGVVSLVGGVVKLPDEGHAILATLIFAFALVYLATDLLWWHRHGWVWLFAPTTIAVAIYWWVTFLAKHGVPAEPLLPSGFYPPDWVYLPMALWIGGYCVWDIIDARTHQYHDRDYLVAGAGLMMIGTAICLFLTLRGPAG